jgi:hypothetical protein
MEQRIAMTENNQDNGIGVAILVAGAIAAILIWKLSAALGLQFQTGLSVALRMIVPLILALVFAFSEYWWAPARLSSTWWLVLAVAWWAIWPALDDWGGAVSAAPKWMQEEHIEVYAQHWFQWLVLGLIVGGGGWLTWRRNRY